MLDRNTMTASTIAIALAIAVSVAPNTAKADGPGADKATSDGNVSSSVEMRRDEGSYSMRSAPDYTVDPDDLAVGSPNAGVMYKDHDYVEADKLAVPVTHGDYADGELDGPAADKATADHNAAADEDLTAANGNTQGLESQFDGPSADKATGDANYDDGSGYIMRDTSVNRDRDDSDVGDFAATNPADQR